MFQLRLRLTGLVVFVPNSDTTSKVRMCALLVDARERRTSLDGRPFVAHEGSLKITVGGQTKTYPVDRRRIFLSLPAGDAANNAYDADLSPPGGVGPLPTDRRASWLLDLARVYPAFVFDDQVFDAVPPLGSVLAQVLLTHGKLRMQLPTSVIWRYENSLSANAYRQVFAHTVDSQYKDLSGASLVLLPFDRPQDAVTLDLGALAAGRPMLIEISNVCPNCPGDPQHPIPDRDTKWFFELMSPLEQARVRDRLRISRAELPFPVPDGTFQDEGPGSTNCVPARGPAHSYTFQELDGRTG